MTGVMTATRPARALSLSGRRRQRAAGERVAELFELHGPLVYGVCRLMLRDPVEAEDAAQQAFLSAYQALLAGQEPREPSAWLGTIARNECRTRLRARRTEPLTLVREPAGEELQREVDRHDEIQALCGALAELPHQQRDAIVLREFYGLSYAEVGAALGLSGAAVESVIFRSRKRLQEQLRPARSALGVLTLPLSLRESLAQLLPGFGAGGASAGAGAAVFAKFASAPVAAKLAAAALAVGAAGTVARIETTPVARQHARPPARLAAVREHVVPARPDRVVAATRPVELVVRKSPVVSPSGHSGSGRGAENENEQHSGGVAESDHSGSGGGTTEPAVQETTDGHSGSGDSGSGGSGSGDSGSAGGEHSGSGDSGSGDSGSGHSGDGDPVAPGD